MHALVNCRASVDGRRRRIDAGTIMYDAAARRARRYDRAPAAATAACDIDQATEGIPRARNSRSRFNWPACGCRCARRIGVAARLGASGVEIDARGEIRPQELTPDGLARTAAAARRLGLARVGGRISHAPRLRRGRRARAPHRGHQGGHEVRRRLARAGRRQPGRPRAGRSRLAQAGSCWSQSLADLGDYGQHVGAILAAQTGTESGADLARSDRRAAAAAGRRSILDPGNLIINGFSPLEAVESLGARDPARTRPRRRARPGARPRPGSAAGARLGRFSGPAGEPWKSGSIAAISPSPARTPQDPQAEIGEAVEYLKNL